MIQFVHICKTANFDGFQHMKNVLIIIIEDVIQPVSHVNAMNTIK